jgi:diamine N-acetyltransferase
MGGYKLKKLESKDYYKCNNIWDMSKNLDLVKMFYGELISGNRITFIYLEDEEFLGEGSLVLNNNDPDYTIPHKRIYLSHMIIKAEHRNRGIGNVIVDHLIDYAIQLGYDEISLGVDKDNVNARYLYEKKGFTNVIFTGEDEYGEYVKLLKKLR